MRLPGALREQPSANVSLHEKESKKKAPRAEIIMLEMQQHSSAGGEQKGSSLASGSVSVCRSRYHEEGGIGVAAPSIRPH